MWQVSCCWHPWAPKVTTYWQLVCLHGKSSHVWWTWLDLFCWQCCLRWWLDCVCILFLLSFVLSLSSEIWFLLFITVLLTWCNCWQVLFYTLITYLATSLGPVTLAGHQVCFWDNHNKFALNLFNLCTMTSHFIQGFSLTHLARYCMPEKVRGLLSHFKFSLKVLNCPIPLCRWW